MNVFKHLIEDLELDYENHPRLICFAVIVLFWFLILIQSYFAAPRNFTVVFLDTWEILFFVVPLLVVVARLKIRNLLLFGGGHIILGISVAFLRFPSFIKIEYATLFFLTGIWLIGEWFNYRKFKKCLLSELLKGNYYLAFGLVLSAGLLGSIVEFVNAPAGLWWYRFPFPSLEIFGVPIFIAVFGWFPWILAMFIFLYPFALKKPKKFRS